MSYEAWRREVALGRMPDWDEDKNDYAGAPSPCEDCVWRMVHDPPTRPHQRCRHGHPLPWRREGSDGWLSCDDEG